jgi:peptidoglycan hydrolase-like protein with peptidoglycan-binding domain
MKKERLRRLWSIIICFVICSTVFVVHYPITVNASQQDDIVNVALAEEGYTESSGKINKYGEWFGNNGVDWCAIFISWCAWQAGISSDIIRHDNAWAGDMEGSEKVGNFGGYYYPKSYVTTGNFTPQRGDIVYYDGGEINNSSGHVEIVIDYDPDNYSIDSIGGNTKMPAGSLRGVRAHYGRSLSTINSATTIIGFERPNYDTIPDPIPNDDPYAPYPRPTGDVSIGMKGDSVRWVQYTLSQWLGYDIGSSGIDGDFGDATETAVANYQNSKGLTPDGIVGEQTRAAIIADIDWIIIHQTHDPDGHFDSATGGEGCVTVKGWAYDADTPNEACEIHIYMDGPAGQGVCVATGIIADQESPDVTEVMGYPGNHRFDATINLSVTGEHTFYAHAINRGGGEHNPLLEGSYTATIKETEKPVISDIQVYNIDATGYSISCTVTDNVGVAKVQFPTWTDNNGQDDLIWHDATADGNSYSYRVSISDHKNEYGRYITHIYAWDTAGNEASAEGTDFTLITGSKMDKGAGQTIPDGDYCIFSKLKENYYLDIDGSEVPAESKTNVHMWTSSSSELPECDIWTVKYAENGFYTISQKGTEICLDLYGANTVSGANVCAHTANGSDAQLWSISSTDTGYKIQAKCSGYCLDVDGGKKDEGTNVQVWKSNNTASQRWDLIPLSVEPQVSLWGDTDCNDEVDVLDAVLLARVAAEDTGCGITDQGKINADVTHDSAVKTDDLTKLLKYLAGLLSADALSKV